MRTHVLILTLAMLALVLPTAAAGPPDAVGLVQDTFAEYRHCFLILTQPAENPVDAALGLAKVALCIATT